MADGLVAGRGAYGSGAAQGLHGSAPWFLGYHALTTLDYDLAAEFEPWAPPQPFDDNTYAFPHRVFTKPELLGYVDWCRGRVRQTLDGLTEEMAASAMTEALRALFLRLDQSKVVDQGPGRYARYAILKPRMPWSAQYSLTVRAYRTSSTGS